jgi:small subunit ribosomal protein S3
MIERKFISRNLKRFLIGSYIEKVLGNVGYGDTKVQRTPLGEKVIISASRPGLVVGRKGSNIKKLTSDLKEKFKINNPQIEISEVEDINLDANVVAERICSFLERFGSSRFKSIGHKVIEDVIKSGALGIEIIISGKIPGARAKSWRFYKGYLKKCGDMAVSGIKKATKMANLKSGTVGIKVRIMPAELKALNSIELRREKEEIIEEVTEEEMPNEKPKEVKEEKPEKKIKTKKQSVKKNPIKKQAKKKEEEPVKKATKKKK